MHFSLPLSPLPCGLLLLQGNSLALGQVGQSCGGIQKNGIATEERQLTGITAYYCDYSELAESVLFKLILLVYGFVCLAADFEKSQPVTIPDAAKRKKKKRTRATDSSTGTFDGNKTHIITFFSTWPHQLQAHIYFFFQTSTSWQMRCLVREHMLKFKDA